MSKQMATEIDLQKLSDEDLARLESRLFCAGGPPERPTPQMQQACVQHKKR